jgi:hypothetical protein
MLTRIFAHYKTTLAGLGVAVLTVVLNGRTPHSFGVAIATAVLGALAKD